MQLKTVDLAALSAAELRSTGRGMVLTYGRTPSPFGEMLLAYRDHQICHLSFHDALTEQQSCSILQAEWQHAELRQENSRAKQTTAEIFSDQAAHFQLLVHGTDLQIAVWQALLHIPRGSLSSYGAVAAAIGKPKAVRAVATAIGKNSISYLIPCHRVIRKSGELGGYRWGLERKMSMLQTEAKCSKH
ncbi:MAG: methylated-DNA--[protein]-cysteine S-methyltransferase [Akkermansiaceae bacterium]